MKKVLTTVVVVLLATLPSFPCTNLLVGKKASTDGSTLISYAADSYGLYGELYHWPAKQYAPGEMHKCNSVYWVRYRKYVNVQRL